MKKAITLIFGAFMFSGAFCQQVAPTNVYPSNLEENMYFDTYDDAKGLIKGMYFLILSDGDNSAHVTPSFETSIYLLPEGSSSREDLIILKVYQHDGIYHMGSHEFKNETISLAGKDIQPGNYRLGIWVNSSRSFEEDTNDNAVLFKKPIRINTSPKNIASTETKPQQKTDDWDIWDEEEEEEEDDDDGW